MGGGRKGEEGGKEKASVPEKKALEEAGENLEPAPVESFFSGLGKRVWPYIRLDWSSFLKVCSECRNFSVPLQTHAWFACSGQIIAEDFFSSVERENEARNNSFRKLFKLDGTRYVRYFKCLRQDKTKIRQKTQRTTLTHDNRRSLSSPE